MPLVLGVGKPLSDVAQFGGLLVVTFAVVAMGEPLRALRLANVLTAASVAVLGWILAGHEIVANLFVSASALAVALLSVPRGVQKEHYGMWDRFVV